MAHAHLKILYEGPDKKLCKVVKSYIDKCKGKVVPFHAIKA
jgi:hypothetical protein